MAVMRIHTSATWDDMREAMTVAGVTPISLAEHGSRKRERAWEVILSGSSPRAAQGGRHKAATWDEWGMFLAHVFSVDPEALTRDYYGARHFHWATAGRYHLPGEVHGDECPQHKWRYSGENPARADEPTHVMHRCAKCGALVRRSDTPYDNTPWGAASCCSEGSTP